MFVEAGAAAKARALAAGLGSELLAEPQAYAKIIEGEAALKNGDARGAIKALTEANTLLDTWIGHFDLGRAYLEAGAFTQADSEFDRCIKRRGEALSMFLDEEPTYGFFPPVYYYQGRVREGLNNDGIRRVVPSLPQHPRRVEGRSAPSGCPQTRRPGNRRFELTTKRPAETISAGLLPFEAGYGIWRPHRLAI